MYDVDDSSESKIKIENDNYGLVRRMLSMQSEINNHPAIFKRSLNEQYQRNRSKSIHNDNKQILHKLQRIGSYYSYDGMQKSMEKYKRLKTCLARSRMDQFYSHTPQIHSFSRIRPSSAKK